ncbi:MAG: hypothetical protein KBS94_06195 [Prevotella sp.]|nr:hypothetical protein [Candidatus Equicola faecalis]
MNIKKTIITMILAGCNAMTMGQNAAVTVLVAEEAEQKMVAQYLPQVNCVCTGVGASNVIKTLCTLPKGTKVINIGYAGSNTLEIGTVVRVSESHRMMDGTYQFIDHNNPLVFGTEGYPCYTSNSFVTASNDTMPTLYDMELNYMVAFPQDFVGAIKIVSDNLSIDAFRNNAIREAGILTSKDVWQHVVELYHSLIDEQK